MSVKLKKEANDIANKAIAELGGDWKNKVFDNLGWVIQIESKELGLYMHGNESVDGVMWDVYSESENGFFCSATTPTAALTAAADIFSKKTVDLENTIARYKSIVKSIKG